MCSASSTGCLSSTCVSTTTRREEGRRLSRPWSPPPRRSLVDPSTAWTPDQSSSHTHQRAAHLLVFVFHLILTHLLHFASVHLYAMYWIEPCRCLSVENWQSKHRLTPACVFCTTEPTGPQWQTLNSWRPVTNTSITGGRMCVSHGGW